MTKNSGRGKNGAGAKSEFSQTEKNGAGAKSKFSQKPKKYEKVWTPPAGFFDDMPPPRGKGWPVPRNAEEMAATLERLRLGRERAKARRAQEALERAQVEAARRRAQGIGPGGQRIRKPDAPVQGRRVQILEAMAPGEWYGLPDLIAATGAPDRSVKAMLHRMLREGVLTRAQNPDFDPGKPGGSQSEPQWLYRRARDGA
jgi:hypothetical protein